MTGSPASSGQDRARVFPAELPQAIRDNPLRAAECKVYDRLKHLSSSYTVFYSRPWLGLLPDGREVDGEADFVIAHPDYGLLTIEVKGGSISYEAESDEWRSIDRFGFVHHIRNPVEQARQSKYQLLKKLKASAGWNARFIHATHGVIFPDVREPPRDLGADMPRAIFACREQLQTLHEWVRSRMEPSSPGNERHHYAPLREDGIARLVELIASSFILDAPLATQLSTAERQIVVLTEQQFEVLDGLERNRRCAVAGGAGTGKTLLALEKARRLAKSGRRTLFTCHSRALAAHLGQTTRDVHNLSILAFEDVSSTISQSPSSVSQVGTARAPETIAEELTEALINAPDDRLFDAVVVDEGQDFPACWWGALELCVADSAGCDLYVFYDDNQRVYRNSPRWPADLIPYTLTRNLRNTRTICEISVPFYAGSPLKAAGPEGRVVEWIVAQGEFEISIALNRLIARLAGPDEIAIEDLAILVRHEPHADTYARKRIAGFSLTRAVAPGRGRLIMETVAEFKGLERKVVILVQPEAMIDDPELMYVGVSRARSHLIVIGDPNAMELMRKMARDAAKSKAGVGAPSAR
jgi:hypothetical protein